jgi:hypothetical protein
LRHAKGSWPASLRACLNQSIVNGWADVYALKEKKANRAASSDVARTKEALHKDELSTRGIDRDDLAENARKARERIRMFKQGELH